MKKHILIGILAGFALIGAGCTRSNESQPSAPTAEAPAPSSPTPTAQAPELPVVLEVSPEPTAPPEAPMKKSVSAIPTTPPQPTMVLMVPGGFSPSLLTVKAGEKVTFVNRDSVPRWPASGMHPSHQICPGFDALAPVPPAGTYAFTFTEPKTCPMHDHLSPSLRGSITVTE